MLQLRVLLLGAGGRDDEAGVWLMLPSRSHDLVTVDVRHLKVGHHGVERLAASAPAVKGITS